ncbi:MAG TPA: hypothetical protein PLN85_00180 [archaeon]|nr:hypothetical protein [archaeon]
MITGITKNSRLNELKKYRLTNIFEEQYFGNGNLNNDGVDFNNSISGVSVVYFINSIKYIDNLTGNTTYFEYIPQTNLNDYVDKNYYKDLNKKNVINKSKIYNDVFIERQEKSAFVDNHKLQFIDNLLDLLTYASGKYFNIVDNNKYN